MAARRRARGRVSAIPAAIAAAVNGANRSNNISMRHPRSITTLRSVPIKVAVEAVLTAAGVGEVRLRPATAEVVAAEAATLRAVIAAVSRV
jgi:hypothetical protein